MRLDYDFKPVYVKRVAYVTHMAKPGGYSHRSHAHARDAHEIVYVDYGVINLAVGKRRFQISPGECVFIPGRRAHAFLDSSNMPVDYMNIIFFGKLPPALSLRIIPANKFAMEVIKEIKIESVNEQKDGFCLMCCLLTEFMIYLLRQLSGSLPKALPQAAYRKQYQSEVVNRALSVIEKDYSQPLTLAMVAHCAGIGVSRLRQLLKSETGQNFSTHLHQQRVAAAKHLLSEGAYGTKEIGLNIGYSDTSFFFKIFKRLTGKTPMAFAKSLGEPTD
jgi:AraC-like DNA-binding protein